MTKRQQSESEEIANATIHGIGLVAALAAIPFLFQLSESTQSRAVNTAGSAVFAATLVLLYLCSTLYHALSEERLRLVVLRLDHDAIYLFIAGSFTPFALGSHEAPSGWLLLALVWLLALVGFVLKACGRLSHPLVSTGLYLLMGWSVLTIATPLIQRLSQSGML